MLINVTCLPIVATRQSHLFITVRYLNDAWFLGDFMTQQSVQQSKELERLNQLIGEWAVGVAMKATDGKIASGCGEMSAVEIVNLGVNTSMNMHIEGYDDYYENDLWSFDRLSGKVHLFSVTSEGDAHDHSGEWKDEKTLILNWKGIYEKVTEEITVKWVTEDQVEVKENDYQKGKLRLTIDYVFKRKETTSEKQ